MIGVANLDPSLSPTEPYASLLSGDPTLRTLRVVSKQGDDDDGDDDGGGLSPPQVIAFCKQLGSGKLGRVSICADGSAVFDLSKAKAEKLMDAAKGKEFVIEMPLTLPAMS